MDPQWKETTMTVLVSYATEHGATGSIAARITIRLQGAGLTVDLRPVAEAASLDGYDAVVLGSAIHNGGWLPQADALVHREAAALGGRPTWLFSVGMLGDASSALGPRASRLLRSRQPLPDAVREALAAGIPANRHRRFAGVFLRTHTTWWAAGVYRAMGGRFGDHRDWSDVQAWADGIAEVLTAAGVPD
jgi:menaquinone-dependent protoporphyrinogen oxidase